MDVNQNNCWPGPPQGCTQDITGTDTTTGHSWPPSIWGGGSWFLLLSDVPGVTATTIGNYMFNQLVNVQGHTGVATNRALYSQITKAPSGQNPMGAASTTNLFELHPASEGSGLYISYWLRFQPGMTKNMIDLDPAFGGIYGDGGTWRSVFAFKTGTRKMDGSPENNGDYRVEAYVITGCPNGFTEEGLCPPPPPQIRPTPFWACVADNNAGGVYPLVNDWSVANATVPVPDDGQWFKVEIFWHRSALPDGRFWMAVNGTKICDRFGANMGAAQLPINRITVHTLYSGGRFPIYQWVDDMQIWDGGFPTATDDPPYAPH